MTDHEKLVEMISSDLLKYLGFTFNFVETIADHMIANGVTINSWRDARTNPPELPDVDYCHVDVLAVSPQGESSTPMRYERVMVRSKRTERWVYGNGMIATPPERWMPLPKPPKEEPK